MNTNILDQTDNFDFLAAYQAYECYDDDELTDDENEFNDEECQPADRIKTPMPLALVLASTEFVSTQIRLLGESP